MIVWFLYEIDSWNLDFRIVEICYNWNFYILYWNIIILKYIIILKLYWNINIIILKYIYFILKYILYWKRSIVEIFKYWNIIISIIAIYYVVFNSKKIIENHIEFTVIKSWKAIWDFNVCCDDEYSSKKKYCYSLCWSHFSLFFFLCFYLKLLK